MKDRKCFFFFRGCFHHKGAGWLVVVFFKALAAAIFLSRRRLFIMVSMWSVGTILDMPNWNPSPDGAAGQADTDLCLVVYSVAQCHLQRRPQRWICAVWIESVRSRVLVCRDTVLSAGGVSCASVFLLFFGKATKTKIPPKVKRKFWFLWWKTAEHEWSLLSGQNAARLDLFFHLLPFDNTTGGRETQQRHERQNQNSGFFRELCSSGVGTKI